MSKHDSMSFTFFFSPLEKHPLLLGVPGDAPKGSVHSLQQVFGRDKNSETSVSQVSSEERRKNGLLCKLI